MGAKLTPALRIPFGNTITVGKDGAAWTTIAEGIAASSAGDLISVSPGTYVEDNSAGALVLKDGTALRSTGGHNVTTISFNTTSQDGMQIGDECTWCGFSLTGTSGAGKAGLVVPVGTDHCDISDCEVLDCDIGISVLNTSGAVALSGIIADEDGGTSLVQASAGGKCSVDGTTVFGTATWTNSILSTGAGSVIKLSGGFLIGGTVTNSVHAAASGEVEVIGAHIDGGTTGVRVGASAKALLLGVDIDGTGTSDIVVEDATGTLFVSAVRALPTKTFIASGATASGSTISDLAGDIGAQDLGQRAIGRHNAGAEFVVGGDSTTLGMSVFTNTDASDPDGAGTWADVTTAAASATGSTFTMLPALIVGSAVYFVAQTATSAAVNWNACPPGFKVAVTTAAVPGAGALQWDVWTGATWETLNGMSTNADTPYQQYGSAHFERIDSEQIRIWLGDVSPAAVAIAPGEAFTTTGYVVRCSVITAAITTAPVLQQVKLHTPGRFEANADGFTELFGAAIVQRVIPLGATKAFSAGGSPSNETVAVSSGITYTGLRNGYAGTSKDGVSFTVPVLDGLDTSRPLTMRTLSYPKTSSAGAVEIETIAVEIRAGNTLGSLAEIATATVHTLSPATADIVQAVITNEFSVPDVVPGDTLEIAHFRDGQAGNGDDTFSGTLIIKDRALIGWFWR